MDERDRAEGHWHGGSTNNLMDENEEKVKAYEQVCFHLRDKVYLIHHQETHHYW